MEMKGTLAGDGEAEWGRGQVETSDGDVRWGDVRGERWMGR